MNCFKNIGLIAIDQPFLQPNGLVVISPTEQTLSTVILNNNFQSVLLTGEIGWRIVPFVNSHAQGRLEIKIKRNGQQIYKKIADAFVPVDFSCARTSTAFTCLDSTPPTGRVKYELVVSGTSENVDLFRVTGPVNLVAMGIK